MLLICTILKMKMFRFVPKMYPSEFYHLSIYPSNCILQSWMKIPPI